MCRGRDNRQTGRSLLFRKQFARSDDERRAKRGRGVFETNSARDRVFARERN